MDNDSTLQTDFLTLRRFEDPFPAWMIVVPIIAGALLFLLVMWQRPRFAHKTFLGRLVSIFSPPWAFLAVAAACGVYGFLCALLISLGWLLLLPLVVIALIYVGIMYVRDSGSVGPVWASLLGLLRTAVYLILAFLFLLPAWQHSTRTERHSRVVLLFDVSSSLHEVDEVAEDGNLKSLLSRQQKVVNFLADENIGFIKGLLKNNPVTCYRFGKSVDPVPKVLTNSPDQEWTAAGLKDELTSWLIIDPNRKGIDVKQVKLDAELLTGTNLGGSVRQVLEKQAGNMLQGIVIFSDGQSNQEEDMPGSMAGDQIYEELRDQAKRLKVPLMCVGVGKFKPPISIRINDIEAPNTARPDEPFPVNVPVLAQGLKDKAYKVILEMRRIRDAEDKPISEPATELIRESKFKDTEPDRVEYQIDIPGMKKIDLAQLKADTSADGQKNLKKALASIEGVWEFQARVARDKREAFPKAFHTPEQPVQVRIFQKKLRVLLFAGGPSKEYQFLRTVLQREVQANRLELGVYLQTNKEEEIELGQPDKDWVLDHFPIYRVRPSPKEMPYTLFEYDAIVALDPDWGALLEDELKLIKEWCQEKAGGLVMVAGPVNTYQLRELSANAEADILTPIRDLCPMVLQDSRLQGLGEGFDATTKNVLTFGGALSLYDFMKLDEDGTGPIAGWSEFFYGGATPKPNDEPENGFYSYYPIKRAKSLTTVLATFPARGEGGLSAQPFIGVAQSGSGKVVFIGSLETWQLRNYKALYHQHFWIKLVRYVGAGNMGRVQKFGEMNIADKMRTGEKNRAEYRLRGPDGKLLSRDDADKHKLQMVVMPFKKADDPEPDPDVAAWSVYPLKAKPGGKDEISGWFMVEFPVELPGKYQLRLANGSKYYSKLTQETKNELKMKIPGTEEELIKTVLVTQPNPEMDNVKPDLVRLYGLASDNDTVLPRIPKDLEEYKKQLLQVKGPLEEGASTRPRDGRRLYFDLDSAKLIPSLMIQAKESREIKGSSKDWRDESMEVGVDELPAWLLACLAALLLAWIANILILQHEFKVSGAFANMLARFPIYLLSGLGLLCIIAVASAAWLSYVVIQEESMTIADVLPEGPVRFALLLAPVLAAPFLLLPVLWLGQQASTTPRSIGYGRLFLWLLVVGTAAGALVLAALVIPDLNYVPFTEPIKVAYVLAAIVVLLSLEWLARKLLRLA